MNEAAVTTEPKFYNINIPQAQRSRPSPSPQPQEDTPPHELSDGVERNKPTKTAYTLKAHTGYIHGVL